MPAKADRSGTLVRAPLGLGGSSSTTRIRYDGG
jgi:hypothetical protein